jgi:hypothetical protein
MKKLFTFFAAAFISSAAFAQIPNGGFETWMVMTGYDMPTGWDQLNSMTSSMSTYTCMKGTPGTVGTSYIKLVSKTVMGMGVMPGITCAGALDQSVMTNIVPKYGVPSTVRPVSLTGSWQYMAYGADQGHISVLLSKWNIAMSKRDTISYTNYMLPGMAMSWATFTIPLTYMTGAVPDSAIILLSASGTTPVNNSYLYVDNLAFAGTVPTGVVTVQNAPATTSIFPNPAINSATVVYTSATSNDINISVTDINGRTVLGMNDNAVKGENKFTINTSGLSKGMYLVKISNGQDTQVKKLIIE